MMRLAKFIAQGGVCSRRQAEVLILEGRVTVNGELITSCAFTVNPELDQVTVDGTFIKITEKKQVWCFYKPVGMITTHNDPQGRQTVFDYVQETYNLPRVISVGRLDLNSEGLLLLTNDSNFSRMAELPSTKWPRVYKVRVFGDIDSKALVNLKKGCVVEGVRYDSIDVEIVGSISSKSRNHWLMVTLYEGKNREIRKVMSHLGLQVNRLIRLSYGPFSLEGLKPGELREERGWKNLVPVI
jgi:23S rRNA pseudouridine2605 synthase